MLTEAQFGLLIVVVLVVLAGWVVLFRWLSKRLQPARTAAAVKPAAPNTQPPRPARHSGFRSAILDGVATAMRMPLGRGPAFQFDIVGESFHQQTLRAIDVDGKLAEREPVQFMALIVPEPDNPADPHSILVCTEAGEPVGHFPADEAARYAEVAAALMHKGTVGACVGRLTGGWNDEVSVGVKLSLAEPWTLLRRIQKGKPAPPV